MAVQKAIVVSLMETGNPLFVIEGLEYGHIDNDILANYIKKHYEKFSGNVSVDVVLSHSGLISSFLVYYDGDKTELEWTWKTSYKADDNG